MGSPVTAGPTSPTSPTLAADPPGAPKPPVVVPRPRVGRPSRPMPHASAPAPEAWLSWTGRRWIAGQDGGPPSPDEDAAFSVTEVCASGGTGGGRIVHGDALAVARGLRRAGLGGGVDLVYVDPPFASRSAYTHEARLDGLADGRVVRAPAYDDRWAEGLGAYLDMLAPRLEALAGLLAPRGTIWVHVDWRASSFVRLLLDEVLGRAAFKNEIVWRRAPNLGRQAASHQFGRTLDTILVYGGPEARLVPPTRLEIVPPRAVRWDPEGRPFTSAPRGDYTDDSIRRLEREGRVHRTASGKAYVKYFLVKDGQGAFCRERRVDCLWTDVAPLRHAPTGERTGFPTQKPRALLDRIVACASPPGGLVVDLFAGSGTTGESAHALGRRFVLGDASPLAVATARARLLRAGAALVLEACAGAAVGPEGERPTVVVERLGSRARVALQTPREPLAWAIGVAHDHAGPFRTAWHSERATAARSVTGVATAAEVDPAIAPIAVRVWSDDGRVATCVEGAT
jgi:DNA modification methylase